MDRPCWRSLLALLMLPAAFASCSSAAELPSTPSPAKAAIDYAAMESSIEDKITSGSLNLSTIDAVLVSVGGETKVAQYRNGRKPEEALACLFGHEKRCPPALIGIAIDEKIISGLDATLPELLPRYGKYLTAGEKSITLRQLMSMTAGFPSEEPGDKILERAFERTDPIPAILTGGLSGRPEKSSAIRILAPISCPPFYGKPLVRADGEHPRTVLEYAREKLFDPLEIDSSGAQDRRVSLGDPAYDVLPASTGAPTPPGCTLPAACSGCVRLT